MTQSTNILLPVGRLVAGSLTKAGTTDFDGNPLVTKTGPNKGQPREDWFFAVAIPKNGATDWKQTPWGAQIAAVGQAAFPTACQRDDFAWKISDGDSTKVNKKNNRPCDREGYPGNFIVHLSSGFAPKVLGLPGPKEISPELVKPGYYIEVFCSVAGNGNDSNPGVYINHSAVCMRAPGPEINLGLDVASVGFGAGALPAGVSEVPAAAMAAPAATGDVTPTVAPVVPQPTVVVPTVPHVAILVPQPPAPPHVMLPPAQGATYEQCIAAGWTDATLIANGLMQA